MRVLVTGGAGFIGSHLVDALLAAGHQVWVFDNLSTGRAENLAAAVREYGAHGRLHLINGTVTWDPNVGAAFEAARPDVVYHLAAQTDVSTSVVSQQHDFAINVGGTVNMLTAARPYNSRFVFVSSAAIFGNHPGHTQPHPGMQAAPISPYGAAKAAAEVYVDLYDRMGVEGYHSMVCSTVVFSNVYGPRQAPGRGAVNIFTRALLRGEPVTLRGDGENIRDYLYVGDAVQALLWAGRPGNLPGGRMLVGTGVGTTDRELLVKLSTEVTLQTGVLAHDQPPARTAPGNGADVRSSVFPRSELARTPLADGLEVTVEAIRKELGL